MTVQVDKYFEHSCRPGSAAGICRGRGGESCAFDGAMIVLQCIADAAHLVHGPIACLGNSWESRGTVSDKGILHKRAYTTDLTELDIIYGAEEKLFRAIAETRKDSNASAIFVYSTCVTGLIGEDIEAVCGRASRELGIKVIPVQGPGFLGPKNLGNRIAGDVLLEHVIGTAEPETTTLTDINLIGEYNIAGDLFLVEPILKKAGFNVLSHMTGNASFEEIRWAHRAKLNVVVCGRALINVAREMERRYGIPYVEVSFFGKAEFSKALRTIARALEKQGADVMDRTEVLIEIQERKLNESLKAFESLRGKKAVLYSGGVKSWSLISALMDLGITVAAVGTKKSTAEDEDKMRAIMGPDAPLHENMTPANILKLMRECHADILIAGGRNLYLGIKEGFPFVDVNQERRSAYAGYDGLVNLARDIKSSIDFYAGRGAASKCVPVVEKASCAASVNPLKHSPAIGAAMALQGVDGALAVMHGAQGCNFLGKVLLTKHFREPIAMASTKLFSEDVVMGSEERLIEVVEETARKSGPDLIGIITAGLVEVKGENTKMAVKKIDAPGTTLLHISAPDYKGSLQEGYASAVEAMVSLAEPGYKVMGRVNVLASGSLTPADFSLIREIIESFGLEPIMLPDLSALDGSREGFSPLAKGGVPVSKVCAAGTASFTIAIGGSLLKAARTLRKTCGIPYIMFDSITGLSSCDRFFRKLSEIAGRPPHERYLRERRILIDGMRDAAFFFGGKKFALAQESDAAIGLSALIGEMGGETKLAVVPVETQSSAKINARKVVVGDFGSINGESDMLIANSHGAMTAKALGAAHLQWGFPVFERLGHTAELSAGYKGTLNMLNMIGNALMEGMA
ncbi:MAG: nitrogenase iron-molybdenum cofactor biosynthesis protein NifE [Nitrospirota bacterium]